MGTRIETFPPNVRDRIIKAMKATAPEPDAAKEAVELADEIEAVKQEKDLQRLCEQELARRGIPFLHLSVKAREKRGWPDLVFPHFAGRFMAVELKTKNGKLSRDQIDCLNSLHVAFAMCAVVRSYTDFCGLLDGSMKCRYMGEA